VSQELLHPARTRPGATTASARADQVDAKAGLRAARRVSAAVVRREEGPTLPTCSSRISALSSRVQFCSVRQVDTGTDVPRFITMYPR
jgi:hypothetical protein